MPAMTKTTIAQKNAYHASVVHILYPYRNSLLCNDFRHALPGVDWFSTVDSTMPHEPARGLDHPGQKFDFAVHPTIDKLLPATSAESSPDPRPQALIARARFMVDPPPGSHGTCAIATGSAISSAIDGVS